MAIPELHALGFRRLVGRNWIGGPPNHLECIWKMKEKVKQDAVNRLSRMAGQVNGIKKMVEDERYCVDILTQVAALRAALDQLGVVLLSTHLENCVYGHDENGDHPHASTSEERLEEIRVTLNRFLK